MKSSNPVFDSIDKVALGTAALYGLREDNNLVGQQYSWLGSILPLGVGYPLLLTENRPS